MPLFRLAFLILLAASGRLHAAELPPLELFQNKEVTDIFSLIPVQESGRIKPLEAVAMNRLRSFRARASLWLTENGEMDGKPLIDPATQKPITHTDGKKVKLSSTEWLLMSWFRPDIGRLVPLFKVDNSSAITELGLTARAKRDQYSFAEIEPARDLLMQKMDEYRSIPPKQQAPEQRMLVQLALSFLDYEMMLGHFDFVRSPLGGKLEEVPAGLQQPVRYSKSLNTVVKAAQEIVAALRSGARTEPPPWFSAVSQTALNAIMSGNSEQTLRIFPPAPGENSKVWHGPGEIIFTAFKTGRAVPPEQLAWLGLYEDVYLALPDAAKFKTAAQTLLTKIQAAAAAIHADEHVALERSYLRTDYFFYAQWFFLGGLVFAVLSFIPSASLMTRIAYGFICAGLFLSLVGTILGGIWANYSWGRFWGWDPKENGALMIVLMCLIILHARLGGYIRETGLHSCNLVLGCIVVFSWFGVNQLGVGLHAYGFTDGTWPKIYAYWSSQATLLLLGLLVLLGGWAPKEDVLSGFVAKLGRKIVLGIKFIAVGLLVVATAYAVMGVTVRCIIMQRPPITTLYETILFIGAACALFGLVAELITRKGLGLLVCGVAGTACMFLAIQFEASEGADTMQQLQAVLITNFWLSTHVPLINLGYAACMVAALISQFFFLLKIASCAAVQLGIVRRAPAQPPETAQAEAAMEAEGGGVVKPG
ncbi:cytochrome c biogenesis protein CcsA [Prosthecobacter sp.]|uniref:cytochrome c biogenesis protein CcsA n=1 Tax=Prosthecobacter sp. TaxID=1965333 RepID=UPI0037853200